MPRTLLLRGLWVGNERDGGSPINWGFPPKKVVPQNWGDAQKPRRCPRKWGSPKIGRAPPKMGDAPKPGVCPKSRGSAAYPLTMASWISSQMGGSFGKTQKQGGGC